MTDERRVNLEKLNIFCQQNAEIDFRTVDLSSFFHAGNIQWLGFENDKDNLMSQLKAYQRMLWIVPKNKDYLAIQLLENGFSSPVQIASMPKQEFIEGSLTVFDNDSEIARKVYAQAVKLVKKVSELQQGQSQPSNISSDSATFELDKLETFLNRNKDIDFRTADLLHDANFAQYQWVGLEAEKESLIEQLKAYQRLLRVVPSNRADLAKKLLENGIQSSLQIISIPKKVFIQDYLSLFNNDSEMAEQVYLRALTLRKAVALQYVARVQQAEPTVRSSSVMR